jgi:octanoyl-[GcvH]:protein N-octanoyltransferase
MCVIPVTFERKHSQSVPVITDSFADRPAFGAAVSRAILLRVAAGELPPTVRLHRTGRVVAFGRQDAAAPGFSAAVEAARGTGFDSIVRVAGGRAAVYHEGTIALSRAIPDPNPAARTHARFEELAGLVAAALRDLGVDARVGEVPGEYCPGEYSVNAGGRTKLVGIGQRILAGGAHLGVVIVGRDSGLLRRALIPVYDALELEWDPATAGSVEDELGGVELESIEEAILDRLRGAGDELLGGSLDADTLALAARLEAEHAPSP